MPKDYSAKADAVYSKLLAKGRAAVIIKLGVAPADPDKPWRGATDPRNPVTAQHDVSIVMVSPSAALGFMSKDSNLFKTSQAWYLMGAPSSVTDDLTKFNELVDGGVHRSIVGMEKLQPGEGSPIIYIVGVEK